MKLKIADGLSLPTDAVTQTIGILAKRRLRARLGMPPVETPVPAVVRLLLRCCPPAVLRRVGAVVVPSIDGVDRRWTRPHVREEGFEALLPPFTDRDSAAAVLGIVRAVRVSAAVSNSAPSVVLLRVAQAVRALCFRRPIALKTPASLDFLPEVVLSDCCVGAAVAPADPEAVPRVWARRFFDHNQPTEALAAQILSYLEAPHSNILLDGVC